MKSWSFCIAWDSLLITNYCYQVVGEDCMANMSHPSWVMFFLRWLKFMKWWFQNFNLLLWLFSKHIWERFTLYWLGTSRSSSVCVFKIFSLLIKTWCFQGLTEATWECIQRSVFEEINECFLMASFSGVTGTYFKFAFFGGFWGAILDDSRSAMDGCTKKFVSFNWLQGHGKGHVNNTDDMVDYFHSKMKIMYVYWYIYTHIYGFYSLMRKSLWGNHG